MSLVCLDCAIDIGDEFESTEEADESQHQEECDRHNRHIAKVIGQLQSTIHIGSMEVVVKRIRQDKESSCTAIGERDPPPVIVFSSQLEVQERNRDKGSYRSQHDKGDK